ncbi:hypothetical protein, partial [Roseibium sp.]|uniref:hypothetical protein n=1 Tax=Roseibium sp. TaxID=1936156 RepID=UPI0035136719
RQFDTMARQHPPANIKPITVSQARELSNGVQLHCLCCANMSVLDLDAFDDRKIIADLSKNRRFRRARCGNKWVETRPNFKQPNSPVTWYGLAQKEARYAPIASPEKPEKEANQTTSERRQKCCPIQRVVKILSEQDVRSMSL